MRNVDTREMNLLELTVMLLSCYDTAIEMLHSTGYLEAETYLNAKYMICDVKDRIRVYFQ